MSLWKVDIMFHGHCLEEPSLCGHCSSSTNAAFTVSETSPDDCLPAHPAPGGLGARSPRPPPLCPPSPTAGVPVRAAVDLLVRLRGERIQRCKETAEDR